MGHHSVPRRYLRGFESANRPNWIWMFDKEDGSRKHLPISQVAQAPEFYDVEVEKALNEEAEKPGSAVIEALRMGAHLDEKGRRHLAYYLATMIGRVRSARLRAEALVPGVLDNVAEEFRSALLEEARTVELSEESLGSLAGEIEASIQRHREKTPKQVSDIIRSPWPYQSWLSCVYNMEWRLLRSTGPSYFLTSDNPVFVFEHLGLNNADSEVCFPLCHWATRFVFYHEDVAWIPGVVTNKSQYLRMIHW
jgi:Protein of unknown function (DUF4238)